VRGRPATAGLFLWGGLGALREKERVGGGIERLRKGIERFPVGIERLADLPPVGSSAGWFMSVSRDL